MFIISFLFDFFLFILGFPFENIKLDKFLFFMWLIKSFYIIYFLFKNKNFIFGIFYLLNIINNSYFMMIYFCFDYLSFVGPFNFNYLTKQNLFVVINCMFFVFFLIDLLIFLFKKKLVLKKIIRLYIGDIFDKFVEKLNYKNNITKNFIGLFFTLILSLLIFSVIYNVFRGPYGTGLNKEYIMIPNMIRSLISLIGLFFYIRIKVKYRKNNFLVILAKILFLLSLFFGNLSYGSRGASVGILMFLLILDFILDRKIFGRLVNLLLNSYLIYILIFLWPIMRGDIYNVGLVNAFILANDKINYLLIDNFFQYQFTFFPMIPMTLFHFLYVVGLMHNGINLHWNTFLHLIPQQIPEFLANLIGFHRPISDPWILAKYVVHGGGFYIFAQAYWNGGLLPLGFFVIFITMLIIYIEFFFKTHDNIYYIIYPMFLFLIPVNNFYGIQPLIRGIEYGFIGLVLVSFFKRVKIRRKW